MYANDLTFGLSASDVGHRLRAAVDELGRNKRVLAFYLADMEERSLYQVSGHGSTVHFGEAQLEMEPRRTREYVQVGRALWDLVLIDEAFCAGEIGWSKLTALLPVVQRDTQDAWVRFAKENSFRDLRTEVGGCRPGEVPGDGSAYGLIHKRVTVQARLEDVHYAMFEEARIRLSESAETLLTDEELIIELLRKVLYAEPTATQPAQSQESPAPDPTLTATEPTREPVPSETREQVLRRDKHRCRNCARHFDVEVHHIRLRSQGGNHNSANLITLCNTCHASVHRGFLILDGPASAPTFTSTTGHPITRGVRTPSYPQPATPQPLATNPAP